MDKIKIIVVDDHPVVRDGIFATLINSSQIEIVGEASNGADFFNLLEKQKIKADLVLLDLSLPKISGVEITKIIKDKYPKMKVLIFSSYSDEDSIFSSLEAGADGYLPKESIRGELLEAILKVYDGEEFLSPSIPNSIILKFVHKIKDGEGFQEKGSISSLSKREIEILRHIAEGFHYKDIGEKLFISSRTVESHKNNIMKKLGAANTIELVKFAIKTRLIEL